MFYAPFFGKLNLLRNPAAFNWQDVGLPPCWHRPFSGAHRWLAAVITLPHAVDRCWRWPMSGRLYWLRHTGLIPGSHYLSCLYWTGGSCLFNTKHFCKIRTWHYTMPAHKRLVWVSSGPHVLAACQEVAACDKNRLPLCINPRANVQRQGIGLLSCRFLAAEPEHTQAHHYCTHTIHIFVLHTLTCHMYKWGMILPWTLCF